MSSWISRKVWIFEGAAHCWNYDVIYKNPNRPEVTQAERDRWRFWALKAIELDCDCLVESALVCSFTRSEHLTEGQFPSEGQCPCECHEAV